jgi:hypothetical protein
MLTDKELKGRLKKVPPLKDLKVGQIVKLHHWWRGFVVVEVLETKKLIEQVVPSADIEAFPFGNLVRLYAVKVRSVKPLPGLHKDDPIEQQILYIFKDDYFEIISNNPKSARILYG